MSETRKIAAILVADVVGYSRLAGADEDRTLSRLRGLRSDLIDPAIAAHHGRVVKRTGDGILIEFRSVVDAVRCAIEVQNGLIERNAGLLSERRIEFRVGIHLGDVVEEADGDLMGDGVNIAARLEGICKPGAVCLSEDAYRQVKGRLDLAVTELGPTELKNIADPIRVYSLEVGAPPQAKPTKRSASKRPLAMPVAGIVALIVIASVGAYFLSANRTATVGSTAATPAEPARLSIVVLPFTNLSNDPNQDYFADGITENLTTELSRIHNSSSPAIPPSASKARTSTPGISARSSACATCWKARCSATEPACASTPSSSIRARARIFGPTVSRRTSPTCSSSRIRWWRD